VDDRWHPSRIEELIDRVAAPVEREAGSEGYWAGVAAAIPVDELEFRYCRSCLVDLHDTRYRGVSDRYCRYCADSQGKLKPRAEVHRLLARWLMEIQGGIDLAEAGRRAEIYMRAMPAWIE
jgi:hypothetical protein